YGMPWSGPRYFPRPISRSAVRAAASASSPASVTTAFSFRPCVSSRSRASSTSATGETSRARTFAASRRSGVKKCGPGSVTSVARGSPRPARLRWRACSRADGRPGSRRKPCPRPSARALPVSETCRIARGRASPEAPVSSPDRASESGPGFEPEGAGPRERRLRPRPGATHVASSPSNPPSGRFHLVRLLRPADPARGQAQLETGGRFPVRRQHLERPDSRIAVLAAREHPRDDHAGESRRARHGRRPGRPVRSVEELEARAKRPVQLPAGYGDLQIGELLGVVGELPGAREKLLRHVAGRDANAAAQLERRLLEEARFSQDLDPSCVTRIALRFLFHVPRRHGPQKRPQT